MQRNFMVLCVLCAAEVKDVEHAMLPVLLYTFFRYSDASNYYCNYTIYFDTRI